MSSAPERGKVPNGQITNPKLQIPHARFRRTAPANLSCGIRVQAFERYPKCIGVVRENCVALLVPGVDGLQILGTPGWRMGEVMGVLTERKGAKCFRRRVRWWMPRPSGLRLYGGFREEIGELLLAQG